MRVAAGLPLLLLLLLLLLLAAPLAGLAADASPPGRARVASRGLGPAAVVPPGDDVRVVIARDDVVLGELGASLGEQDVIVELTGAPLATVSAPRALARAALERQLRDVEGALVQAENKARGAAGLGPADVRRLVRHEYRQVFTGIAARLRRETIAALERTPGVRHVWLDGRVQAFLAESVPLVRADRVWTDLGDTGQGAVVAIVDSGIDYTHPDLGGCLGPACKVLGGYDVVNGDADPMDDHGHGTHVAGIVAANGSVRGVAPDARLMAFKVLDATGNGRNSDVIAGLERAMDPDQDPATDDAADVINLSLGGPGGPDDPVSQAVDTAVAAGAVVVVAAGNTGPSYETIGAPAAARLALTVGASDKTDQLAVFSSRGPAPTTLHIKPDLLAPGVGIRSTAAHGDCLLCDASGYRVLDGTSMAAPHVAGAAALLRARFPSWTPAEVRAALTEHAVDLQLDPFAQGSGRLDVFAAATAPALADRGSLSLGLDDLTQPAFTSVQTLSLTNLDTRRRSYGLSVKANLPPGATATVAPGSLLLNAGQSKSFTLTVSVDNASVPNVLAAPFAYSGTVEAARPGDTLALPFAFVKTPVLDVTFDEQPFILTVDDLVGRFLFLANLATSRRILLPAGRYDVVALYNDAATRVVREGVDVSTRTALSFARSDAVYPLTIEPIDKDGHELALGRGTTETRFKSKASPVTLFTTTFGPHTQFAFSPMSAAMLFEASIVHDDSPVGGELYTFHAHARDGIGAPRTFRNAASDLKRVVMRYAVDPGIDAVRLQTYHCLLFDRGCSATCLFDDPLATAPFEKVAYFLPRPYPEFGMGYVETRLFGPSLCSFDDPIDVTPLLTAEDPTRLTAFVGWDATQPKFTTTADRLHLGIGPWVWSARFENAPDAIRMRAVLGLGVTPYLGQLGDSRPLGPLPYQLFLNGVLQRAGEPFAEVLGATAGRYTLAVPFDGFFMAGRPSHAAMRATFEVGAADPNPPSLRSLTFLSDGQFTDVFGGATRNEVRFVPLDDSGSVRPSLTVDLGSGPVPVALTQAGDEYAAEMPAAPPGTEGTVRVEVTDDAGNVLDVEAPAVFGGTCANGVVELGEACDPPGTAIGCPPEKTCASGCSACVAELRQLIGGDQLLVRDVFGRPDRRTLRVSSSDTSIGVAAPGASGDPTLSGATLEVLNPATGERAVLDLPRARWRAIGSPPGARGYRYRDAKLAAGPCATAALAGGRLQARCRGAGVGLTLDEPAQGSLGVSLVTGGRRYCLGFGGTVGKDVPAAPGAPGLFRARRAAAPDGCAGP